MSRTDVLFQITQIIRSRKFTTAAYLADRLNISIRTVYRYINDLSLAGVPIISQTGKGYWVDKSFDMPPMQLSADELLALSFGSKLVKASADPHLADAAQQLIDKVAAVIPSTHQHLLNQLKLHAPVSFIPNEVSQLLAQLHKAVKHNFKIQIDYCDEKQAPSVRTIWPLATAFWGETWTLAAWCEMRDDFRAFRVDRIQSLTLLKETYPKQTGRTIEDFIAKQP